MHRKSQVASRAYKGWIVQRGALEDHHRPIDEIRKPYKMETREFERRLRLLRKYEQQYFAALFAFMKIEG